MTGNDVTVTLAPGVAEGDTVSAGQEIARVAPKTTSDRKRFDKGIKSLIAEGAVQQLWPDTGPADALIGAVGKLQFEVLQYRLQDEYGVETRLDVLPYECSAWLQDESLPFRAPTTSLLARDRRGRRVVLFQSKYEKRLAAQLNPDHVLLDIA